MAEEHEGHHKKDEMNYVGAITVIIAAIIVAGAVLYAAGNIGGELRQIENKLDALKGVGGTAGTGTVIQAQPTARPTVAATAAPVKLDTSKNAVEGKADAKVEIIEFSDLQCPFCGRFFEQTYGTLKKEYIDTGKAKLVFKHFPLDSLHPDARKAAEAVECARDQGKFWEMHDKIFAGQSTKGVGIAVTKQYAKDLKLDSTKFDFCLDSGDKAAFVEADFQQGVSAGVGGTPTFFINGKSLVGAQPFSAFKAVIDAELAA